MEDGGWVPISRAFVHLLAKETKGRPYSRIEAAYSLQNDFFKGKPASKNGYASLWQWSHGKVTRFFKEMGVEIEKTDSKLGHLVKRQPKRWKESERKTGRKRNESGKIRLIDSNKLKPHAEKKKKEDDRETAGRKDTTVKKEGENKNGWNEFDLSKRFKKP